MEKIEKLTKEVMNEINRQIKIDRITKNVMSVLNDLVCNEEKWITIKPHGENSEDYRHLKLQDGETPKEAIERVYKKEDVKDNKKYNYAKTIEEATDYIKNFTDNFDIKNITLENFNKLNKTLTELKEKYNINKFKNINITKADCLACANHVELSLSKKFANSTNADNIIWFNKNVTSYKKDMQELLDKNKKEAEHWNYAKKNIKKYEKMIKYNRFTSQSTADNFFEDTIKHELGHSLMFNKIINEQRKSGMTARGYNLSVSDTETNKLVENTFKQAKKTGDIYNISQYSSTCKNEFFAECFVCYTNKEKLPDYINNMVETIIKG